MQLTVKKSAIESAAKILSKVIVTNNPLPILADILCEVSDNQMKMTASDSEIDITATVELETMEGDGRFCVNADNLIDGLAQLPEQTITIIATTESDNRFTIRHESGETFFPIESADEYPPIGGEDFKASTKIVANLLRDALKRSVWATALDELRPVMNGVCFKTTDVDDLDIVASDGHVLVVNTLINQGFDADITAVVPKKAAKILADVLPGDETFIALHFDEHKGQAVLDFCTVTFRLIDGNYPNYASVIPQDFDKTAVVDRRDMNECMKSVVPFASDSSKLVTMTFTKDKLTMQGDDPGFDSGANNSIDCDYNFNTMGIGVKGTTILSILKAMNTQTGNIVVKMKSPDTAIVFEPEEQEDEVDVLMLAMPMLTD